jgi:hypothetical protein
MSVRDAAGDYHYLDFGKLPDRDWVSRTYRVADSYTLSNNTKYPLTLLAIYVGEPDNSYSTSREPILLDRIRVSEGGGPETVVESFEGTLRWTRFSREPNVRDTVSAATGKGATDGAQVLQIVTAIGRSPQKRGVYLPGSTAPVPVLASRSFLASSGVGVGGTIEIVIRGQAVPVTIVDVLEIFPTADPAGRGFIVADIDTLFDWSHRVNEEPTRANEAWLAPKGGVSASALADRLRLSAGLGHINERDAVVEGNISNPIISAGASGLLGVGFVAALTVLCLAMALSLLLDAERRAVSTSVLRAVGLAPRSIFAALAIEYAVVVVLGTVLGIALGLRVSALMLRFLDVTEDGEKVLPPFALRTDWSALGVAAGVMVLVAAVSVSLAGYYLRRVAVARALRLSE